MGMMVSPETLRRMDLFAGLEDSMLKAIAMAGEKMEVKKGHWFFREGDHAKQVYIIQKGAVEIKVSLGPQDIHQIGVSSLKEGDLFGWSALVDPYKYQLGAVTSSNCQLIVFDGVRLCEIFTHHPTVGYILMSRITKIIGSRLINLRVQLVSLIEGGRWEHLASQKLMVMSVGGRLKPKDSSLPGGSL
jgi:CRP/FNR family cyclic AMP-dependent transcriptional regulator